MTLYDLKGFGSGEFVVAAGSVRESGEVYTIVDDAPVTPIPDYLVDWFVNDISRFKSSVIREGKRNAEAARKVATKGKSYEVPAQKVTEFLRSRAGSLARLGFDRTDIEWGLKQQAKKFCEGGAELAKNTAKFRKLAFNPKLVIGHATFGKYDQRQQGLLVTASASKTAVLTEIMEGFPKSIPKDTAYDRIERGMQEAGFLFSRVNGADQANACKVRRKLGVGIKRQGTDFSWEREG